MWGIHFNKISTFHALVQGRATKMNQDEYKKLTARLRKPTDINKVASEMEANRELLLILYTHRVVRDATRRYYRVKNNVKRLEYQWKNGTSLLQLAYREDFPPILLSLILLQHMGYPRKDFWKFVNDPSKIKNSRLKHEIGDIVKNDILYSPAGMEVQTLRGIKGEERLNRWLDDNGLTYRNEDDLKGEFKKTPDVLLDEPIIIDGEEIIWIESKANFGDQVEIRRNMKKQLIPYTEIFGNGIVVYWFGFVSDHPTHDGILVVDDKFFTKPLSYYTG